MDEPRTRAEDYALAMIYLGAHNGELMAEEDEPLESPENVRGWFNLGEEATRYGVEARELMAGLEAYRVRGMIFLALDVGEPGRVFVELRRKPECYPAEVRGAVNALCGGQGWGRVAGRPLGAMRPA